MGPRAGLDALRMVGSHRIPDINLSESLGEAQNVTAQQSSVMTPQQGRSVLKFHGREFCSNKVKVKVVPVLF